MNATNLLPTLAVTAKGEIITSNLAEFSKAVMDRLKDFNDTLRTDEDFDRAASDVATLKGAEEALEAARAAILESAGDINATLTRIADLRGEIAAKRLAISRQIEAKKAEVRATMIDGALGMLYCDPPRRARFRADLEAAMKGKRSIELMRTALRDAMEAINQRIMENRRTLDDFERHRGRTMTADRPELELMLPDALGAELTRRKERADHEAEKRELEAAAKAARMAAEAAQAAAAATTQPAPEPVPPANLPPLARAQAMAANPRAPRMIDPEPPEAEPEPTAVEEWDAFRDVFFAALAPVKLARQRLRHQANIARGNALAAIISEAWLKANETGKESNND